MAKKTSRSRRDSRPRLTAAQLQMYQGRTLASAAHQQSLAASATSRNREADIESSAWGHIGEEYAIIRADLIRLLAVAALMGLLILALWFILG